MQNSNSTSKRSLIRTVLAVLAIIGLFVLLVRGVSSIYIFAKFETCIYILLISAPFGWLIYHQAKRQLDKIFLPRTQFDTPVIFSLIYALLTLVTVLHINVSQDKTKPEDASFIIVSKHYEQFNNSTVFYVDIEQPEFVDPSYLMSDIESIKVSRYEYERAIPRKSIITLTYQTGALDIPWYITYGLERLAPHPVQQASDTYPADNPDIPLACVWKSQFDAHAEIGNTPPHNYIRDFWEGGQPRSVEPTINDKRHGIAHYTFANGGMYGDIPWKNGQKHGVFKLYRENGKLDQVLSYKDGKPYGVQQWYKSDGVTLSRSILYLQNGRQKNPSACAGLKGH